MIRGGSSGSVGAGTRMSQRSFQIREVSLKGLPGYIALKGYIGYRDVWSHRGEE